MLKINEGLEQPTSSLRKAYSRPPSSEELLPCIMSAPRPDGLSTMPAPGCHREDRAQPPWVCPLSCAWHEPTESETWLEYMSSSFQRRIGRTVAVAEAMVHDTISRSVSTDHRACTHVAESSRCAQRRHHRSLILVCLGLSRPKSKFHPSITPSLMDQSAVGMDPSAVGMDHSAV